MTTLFSYIDPVSGIVLLQIILAAVVAAVGFFRKAIMGFILLILGRKRSDGDITKNRAN